MHNVFHVSILRKYELDSSHVISFKPIIVSDDSIGIAHPNIRSKRISFAEQGDSIGSGTIDTSFSS